MSPREPSIIARQNTGIPFCTRWRGGGGGGVGGGRHHEENVINKHKIITV